VVSSAALRFVSGSLDCFWKNLLGVERLELKLDESAFSDAVC
jgi:hypothetical protein